MEIVYEENYKPLATNISLAPDPNNPKVVRGSFTLRQTGKFSLSIVGAGGEPGHEKLEGAIAAVPDRMPQIEIAEPEPQVVAVEGWKVPVLVRAADDVGMDRVELSASINGWGPHSRRLELEFPQANVAHGWYEFDLGTLGAKSGDILTYYATAYDTHPGGDRFTETSTYVIQVISEEEYIEFARTKYRMDEILAELEDYRQQLDGLKKKRDKLVEELEGLRQKLKEQGELSPEDQQRVADLEKALQEYSHEAQNLTKRLRDRAEQPQLYEFEKQYADMLRRTAEQLEGQSSMAEQAASKVSARRDQPQSHAAREELDAALERFAMESEPFDEQSQQQLAGAEQDLETLRLADELLSQAERMQSIIQRQRDLADRLAEFRNQEQLTPDQQQRAQRLAKEQDLLRQEMEEATEQLQKAAEQAKDRLPKTASDAQKLCEACRQMGIGEDQNQAARQARSGAGKESFEAAERAAQKLESLQSGMCNAEGAGQEMNLDQGLKLSKGQGKQSLKQLAQGRGIPGMSQGQGQEGGGFGGSRAEMVVLGPATPIGGESDARSGRTGASGPGHPGEGGLFGDPRGAESLTPTARSGRLTTQGNMRGVPVGYRDQAEAYFRRLAEEN
jgi:hypothetical protein